MFDNLLEEFSEVGPVYEPGDSDKPVLVIKDHLVWRLEVAETEERLASRLKQYVELLDQQAIVDDSMLFDLSWREIDLEVTKIAERNTENFSFVDLQQVLSCDATTDVRRKVEQGD